MPIWGWTGGALLRSNLGLFAFVEGNQRELLAGVGMTPLRLRDVLAVRRSPHWQS